MESVVRLLWPDGSCRLTLSSILFNPEKAALIFCSFFVWGPIVINPSAFKFFFSKQAKTLSISFLSKPCFWFSSLMFISSKTGIVLFSFCAFLLMFSASFNESTASILSNKLTAFLTLFDWR